MNMRSLTVYIVLTIVHLELTIVESCPTCSFGDSTALAEFGEALKIIANQELGHESMQSYIDSGLGLNVQYGNFRSNARLAKIIRLVNAKYVDRVHVLRSLSDHVEYMARMNAPRSPSTQQCCKVTSVEKRANESEFNAVFKAEVDITGMCMQVSSEHRRANFGVDDDMLFTFKDNLNQFPRAGWQHVHIYGGESYLYPIVRLETCQSDNMRRKLWYAKSTTPPMDIVIMLDRSAGMADRKIGNVTLLSLAKQIAEHIVNTQSAYSAIAVVAFSNSAHSPQSIDRCYATKTAAATTFNRKIFSEFIMSVSGTGRPRYGEGLQKAKTIIRNTNSSRTKAVVLITGSMPVDTSHQIRRHMRGMSDIHMLTIGVDVKSPIIHSLLSNISVSAKTNGKQAFININDTSSWMADLHPFYKYFSGYIDRQAIFTSAPYYSDRSKEFLWTMSKPVFLRNELIGVVGIDILFSELIDQLAFIATTEKKHIFILNLSEQSVIYHPNLPFVRTDGIPAIADINDLEKDAAEAGIIADMFSGSSAEMTIEVMRHMPRWNVHKEGFVNISQRAKFTWKKFPMLPMAVCIVISDSKFATLKSLTVSDVPFGNIQYQEGRHLCNHFQKAAIFDDTTLWWSPSTFIDPVKRMSMDESIDMLNEYHAIFSGKINEQIFKDGIIDHVQITRIAHDHWMRRKDSPFSIRRYIALKSGIMRVFPGTWHNRTFDPLTRIWYISSSLFPERTFISTPQLDPLGGGVIITMSKSLTVENRRRGVTDVVGVMGLDFTMMYLRARLEQRFIRCRKPGYSCFVIDTSGYVVVHEQFMAPPKNGAPPKSSYVHLTAIEPQIAKNMMERGFMKQIWCHELRTMKKHFMFTVDIRASVLFIEQYPYYEMGYVPKSNMFIFIKKRVTWPSAVKPCVCSSQDGSISRCDDTAECQCPCYREDTDFRFCENKFSANWTLCENLVPSKLRFPSSPQYASKEDEIAVLRQLPHCFAHTCSRYATRNECDLVSHCRWCTTSKDGKRLKEPYCGRHYTCFYGQVGHPSPYGFDSTNAKHFYCGPFCSFGIVGATFLGSSIVVGVAVCARHKVPSKPVTRRSPSSAHQSVPSILISSATPTYGLDGISRMNSMTVEDKLEYVIPFIQTPSSRRRGEHKSHRRDGHHHHHHRHTNNSTPRHELDNIQQDITALSHQQEKNERRQQRQSQLLNPGLLSPERLSSRDMRL